MKGTTLIEAPTIEDTPVATTVINPIWRINFGLFDTITALFKLTSYWILQVYIVNQLDILKLNTLSLYQINLLMWKSFND